MRCDPCQGRRGSYHLSTGGVGLWPQPPATGFHPCRDEEGILLPAGLCRFAEILESFAAGKKVEGTRQDEENHGLHGFHGFDGFDDGGFQPPFIGQASLLSVTSVVCLKAAVVPYELCQGENG